MKLSIKLFLCFVAVSIEGFPGKDDVKVPTGANNVSCDNFVTVNNTHTHFVMETSLNCNLNLKQVRDILSRKGWMNADNYFLNKNNISVDKKIEKQKKLSQIIAENVLNIGHPNHQQHLLSKFLKGFTIGSDGSIKSTTHTLCSFIDGYLPSENDPQYFHEYETSLAFSSETVKRQCSGVNAYSLSLSTPWVSAEAEYRNEQSKKRDKENMKTYLTTRSVYNKKNIEIDLMKLRMDDEFESKVRDAIQNNTDSSDQCTQLIRVLNNYGWYIVSKYTLGGGFYVTEEKKTSSYEEAIEQETTVKASAEAKFLGYGANIKGENSSKNGRSNTSQGKNEQLSFNQIGGGRSAHENSAEFEEKLENNENWRIIRYDYFIPSLMLLHNHNARLFKECLDVPAPCHDRSEMKKLQPKLNIEKYLHSLVNGRGNENYGTNNRIVIRNHIKDDNS